VCALTLLVGQPEGGPAREKKHLLSPKILFRESSQNLSNSGSEVESSKVKAVPVFTYRLMAGRHNFADVTMK